jgi:hypothetical protein
VARTESNNAARNLVATQGQFSTPITSTPIFNGGTVTTMQGPASCLSWRDQARTAMYELNLDLEDQTYPDFDLDEMPQVCMDAVFCNDLDETAAREGAVGHTENQQGLDQLYNLYCKGQGGTGPGGDGALNSCSDRRAGESDLDCVLRNLTD